MAAPFDEDHLQQLVIQYACRTTPVEPLTVAARKDLAAKVRNVWSDLLDGELEPLQFSQLQAQNPQLYCAFKKRMFIGGVTAEAPTVLVGRDTLTLSVPRKLQGKVVPIEQRDLWLKDDANKWAKQALLELQDALSVQAHRAGKIAEMVFGPVTPEELKALSARVFRGLGEVPDNIQVDLTFVKESSGREYNHLLRLVAVPVRLDLPCSVVVRIDINNRDMTKGLHPGDIDTVWSVADRVIPGWVFEKLCGGNDG